MKTFSVILLLIFATHAHAESFICQSKGAAGFKSDQAWKSTTFKEGTTYIVHITNDGVSFNGADQDRCFEAHGKNDNLKGVVYECTSSPDFTHGSPTYAINTATKRFQIYRPATYMFDTALSYDVVVEIGKCDVHK